MTVVDSATQGHLGAARLALGTVQFGTRYGVANTTGRPSDEEVGRILAVARSCGIGMLDTAAAYGDAEARLGDLLKSEPSFGIVTKTPSLGPYIESGADPAEIIERFLSTSLKELGVNSVHALMLHRIEDLLGDSGLAVRTALEAVRSSGRAKRIGVSVYRPEDMPTVFDFELDIVQIPFSILDQRFARSGAISAAKERGIEIHARSALLQGLLAMPLDKIPNYFAPIQSTIAGIADRASSLGLSRIGAAIAYVCALGDLDYVVVGVDSAEQLSELCCAAMAEIDSTKFDEFSVEDESFLLPFNWNI